MGGKGEESGGKGRGKWGEGGLGIGYPPVNPLKTFVFLKTPKMLKFKILNPKNRAKPII